MFSGRNSTDKLEFIARQLANLMEEQSAEAALATVASQCPPDYAAEVEAFRALLSGSAQEQSALNASAYKTLNALMPLAPATGGTLFREYNAFYQRSRLIFDSYWSGIVGLIGYLTVISVVALLLGSIFAFSVLPPMQSVFESQGADLPVFTKRLFGFGGTALPALAFLLTLAVGAMAWFAYRFRNRARKLAPLPRWSGSVPIIGPITESYNFGLFLNFARMLRQCDVPADEAISAAARASNQAADLTLEQLTRIASDSGHRMTELTELAISSRLGNLDPELAYQCDQHVVSLSNALVSGRDRLGLLLRLMVYSVVAAVVIAIYLPLFQMTAIF